MLKEFESVAKRLEADFEETQILSHRGVKGQTRERAIVHTFLQPYLPKRYSIGGGLLVDSTGRFSQQQDLVIYDEFSIPTLQDHEENKLFFAEQVLITIEVKSTLDRNAARDIVNKANSVGSLQRRSKGSVQLAPGFGVNTTAPPIVGFGFGYSSNLKLDDIRNELQNYCMEIPHPNWPSAILVLNDRENKSGVIVNVNANNLTDILVFPQQESRFASVKTNTQGKALLYFYLLLMQRLQIGGLASPGPDFMAYAAAAGLGEPKLSVDFDALSGTRFSWNEKSVEVDEMLKLRKLLMKLNSDEQITDEEIINLFMLIIQTPNIDSGFRKDTVFVLDNQVWTNVSPKDVGYALEKYEQNNLYQENADVFDEFIKLIRAVRNSSNTLQIIDTQKNSRHFAWRGSKEDGK